MMDNIKPDSTRPEMSDTSVLAFSPLPTVYMQSVKVNSCSHSFGVWLPVTVDTMDPRQKRFSEAERRLARGTIGFQLTSSASQAAEPTEDCVGFSFFEWL